MEFDQVELSLPKWKYTSKSILLKEVLSELGMPVAFSDRADFSGMDGRIFLHISNVIHKAFISVNEAGTEAAAATAVVVAGNAAEPVPKVFSADRPFIYFIRDIQTGSILFVGRVTSPRAN
jgi:serpin B